ncbi:MAG TPA: alpha/beta hydrolase-fold protein [Solirubrobacteraceae bacterium]|nr:alpha/beta hydrolase-fold protein [Solirubrobacteraceae bacterium]
MSATLKARRTHVWMESLGDWSWPGTRPAAAEIMPPSWIPAFPPRLETVALGAVASAWEPQRAHRGRLAVAMVISALAALCSGLAIDGPAGLERLVGYTASSSPPAARFATSASPDAPSLPTLTAVSSDSAGSSIDTASYHSPALDGTGHFYVYLPAGFDATTAHYPVIYLLHGNSQRATAFLQVGLQGELDRLIAQRVIPPMIAVMIQGGPGANNWRNQGRQGYESYVLEVQQLVDRMLPTIPTRTERAIAGDSMGGYGAMNIALGNPYRFAVVESWLGFFNGLEGELSADRPVLDRLGMRAFVYGAEADRIADPAEDAPFAEAMRAAGATAHSAVFPGGHSLETVEAHLVSMLTYAGRALAAASAEAAREAEAARQAEAARNAAPRPVSSRPTAGRASRASSGGTA